MTATTENYGWQSAAPACSTAYVVDPVVAELKRAGAKRVVDLGCGNGAVTHLLQAQGFAMTGCDPDARGIELARQTESGATFEKVGLSDPADALGQAGFDAAVATEVVEHLYEPATLPRFAAQVLKPGGLLIVTTPYHGYLKNLLITAAGKWDAHHGPMWDGGHIKFWSRRTLSDLLTQNGFDVERFVGAGRLPYLWKSMVLVARLRSS